MEPNVVSKARSDEAHDDNNGCSGVCAGGLGEESLAAQTEHHRDAEEVAHFESICESFRQHAIFSRRARTGHAARIAALPATHQSLLPLWMQQGSEENRHREVFMQEAEKRNQFFFDSLLRHAGKAISQEMLAEPERKWSSDDTMSKVSSVLKSLARDWSAEGVAEREQSYRPILDGFDRHVKVNKESDPPRILVPGAGVGRLAVELASRGYEVQGNEFSLHMLLASDFILNGGCTPQRPYAISPWLLETRNVLKASDPFRKILVPDIDPAAVMGFVTHGSENEDLSSPPEFSMAAGDFVSIYGSPNEASRWNGIASCFFLDTAPCVVEYLKVMFDMLKEGGVLINFGPLLFHWSGPPLRPDDISFEDYKSKHSHLDERYFKSIDMPYDGVREVLLQIGFEIVEEITDLPALYTADSRSMMGTEYQCVYFVARKPVPMCCV
eukprot:CAMPEP_0113572344 /NCGR_PEP_ID=MMETSP0015_2-20120614/26039_1 /TAXON_ID=2838 /ORGANISM="Odontella" /LENGTH=440 /DNA_ID=CAMNT_0000475359 /DNA_START=153 /DNA_END=1472 /DNA_ORIENTATION=+ /assembly_acc=CAM_ASM_000160